MTINYAFQKKDVEFSDVLITGDLTVNGKTTQVDDIVTTDVIVEDANGNEQFKLDGDTSNPFFDVQGNKFVDSGSDVIGFDGSGNMDFFRNSVTVDVRGGGIEFKHDGDSGKTRDNFRFSKDGNRKWDFKTDYDSSEFFIENSNQDKQIRFVQGGDVKVPNGDLDVNISDSSGGEIVLNDASNDGYTKSIIWQDEGNEEFDLAYRSETSPSELRLRDSSDNDIVTVDDNNDVEIPNGGLDLDSPSNTGGSLNVGGNALMDGALRLAGRDGAGQQYSNDALRLDGDINFDGSNRKNPVLRTPGNGSGSIRIYDDANNQYILKANEGGKVEVANGNLGMSGNKVVNADKVLMDTNSSDYSFVLKGDSTDTKAASRGKIQDTGASGSSAEAGFSFRDANDDRIGYNVMSSNTYYVGSDLPNAETLIRSGGNRTAIKADPTQKIEIPSGDLQFTNNHNITGGSGNARLAITSGSTGVKSQTGQTLFTGWSGGELRIIDDGNHPVVLYDESDGGAMVEADASNDTVKLIDSSTDTTVLTSNPGGNQDVEIPNGSLVFNKSPDYDQARLGNPNNIDDFELDIDHSTKDRIRWIRNPSADYSLQVFNDSTSDNLFVVKDDGNIRVDNGDIDQSGSNASIIHDRQTVSNSISTDGSGYYSVDSSGGARTLTLSSSDAVDGKEINVKRNGANTVTVDTEGSETIDGSTDYTLSGDNDSITLVYNSDNSEWEIF